MNTQLSALLSRRVDAADDLDIMAEPMTQVTSHLARSRELWTAMLFTDLEGSTSLWRMDPPAMERALAAHDFVLHHLVAHYQGVVFKTAGDAILAAFSDVAGALQCAMVASTYLQRLDLWYPSCRLGARLRVVVHAGRVFVRDGDCFGPEVCYASRLVAVAPAREILVTESALVAMNRVDLPSLQFEAYRTGPLRDFERERAVYRLNQDRYVRQVGQARNATPSLAAADD